MLAYQLHYKYNYNCIKPTSLQTDGLFLGLVTELE